LCLDFEKGPIHPSPLGPSILTPGPPVSRAALPRSPCTPSLSTGPRGRPTPSVSRAHPRPVIRARQPRADAGCPSHFPPRPGPPLSPPFCLHASLTPPAPSVVSCPPPLKGCCRQPEIPPPRRAFRPALKQRPQLPLVFASSRRTVPEVVATPSEPPSTETPSRRLLPATPPTPDLLDEPRLHSPCPSHSPHSRGARAQDLAAG
jgi:hypothetical protein